MICKEDKDSAIRVALEDLSISFSADIGAISSHHSFEDFWCHIRSTVVNVAASIDIFTIRLVEHFSLERILSVMSDIIYSQVNDLVLRNSVLLQDLVSMACVSLMSVVPVTVRSSNNNGPVIFRRAHGES